MTEERPTPPTISPMLAEVQQSTFPLFYGPPEVVDGYCSLEIIERNIFQAALNKHATEVALWYEGLGLLMSGMEGVWDIPQEEPVHRVVQLELQLIGLSVSTAKAGLDAIMAGYYSVAFSAIRHMFETIAHTMYLDLDQEYRLRWEVGEKPLGMRNVVDRIKKRLKDIGTPADDAEAFEDLYACWARMCKGSHPSGEGLLQVHPQGEDPRHIMGATYQENLAYVGMDHGLSAIDRLLEILRAMGRNSDAWREHLLCWRGKRLRWIDDIRQRDDLRYMWEEVEEVPQLLDEG